MHAFVARDEDGSPRPLNRAAGHRPGGAVLAVVACLLALTGLAVPGTASATLRYVNRTDATCGGAAPCYQTIQAAVTAALAGDTITIQPAGVYVEQVVVQSKNSGSGRGEIDRILIQGDPAAPAGSVILSSAPESCGARTVRVALQFKRSRFVTVRGLTIVGNGGIGVVLSGTGDSNDQIRLERNRIVGNGSACSQGVALEAANTGTLIVNNLIYGHGRNGVEIQGPNGGPQFLIQNTIHGNGRNGVVVARGHLVALVNNAVTHNGSAPGTTGGRSGVFQETHNFPKPDAILLANNLVCGNRLGEIIGPALDGGDTGNLTPTAAEGPGVVASPGCALLATVYADLPGLDGTVNTIDDDFAPASGSPAIDAGVDPRTLGIVPREFDPAVTTDLLGTTRPQAGRPESAGRFDIGAIELVNPAPDTIPPTVTILQPSPSAHGRAAIALEAQASDAGTGVASVEFRVDTTVVATRTNPAHAEPFLASAPFDTTTVLDGAHTLRVTAWDRAGHSASATQTVLVDNTPPTAAIIDGPTGTVTSGDVGFTFTGTDNLTATGNLAFAWRLDDDPFSAFGVATTASFSAVPEGPHTFEVKARDQAGNEDPAPTRRTFTVAAAAVGPAITAVSPSSAPMGALVTITGERFDPGATQVTFNGVPAIVRSITATAISTTVPVGAITGPITVTTTTGTATVVFTVAASSDVALTASPATVRVIAGDQGAVSVVVTGSGTFANSVLLDAPLTVPGLTVTFSAMSIAPGAGAFARIAAGPSLAPGTYPLTIHGRAQLDGQLLTRTAAVTIEVLAPETTALTGSVLTAEPIPRPIPGVTVTLGSAFTLTDAAGNFVLLAPPSGASMLFVDGRTASTPEAQFPIIETQVNVAASGPTRVPFVIYLPKLDTAHPIALPVTSSGVTSHTVRATTPRIPGLEVTVPAGTRIIDGAGNPVVELVITPVPVDRSPMPFPPGITPPLLFAVNPGGAVPSQPLPISFPNLTTAPPGARADLYYFDLAAGDWRAWGTGTVSADGTRVVSDPGFGLPRLAWHFFALQAPLIDQVRPRNLRGGDPVDLVTGRFVVDRTDLVLSGRIPIAVQRTYRSETAVAGALGIGWNLDVYETRLLAAGGTLSLVMPNQTSYVMSPDGAGRWVNASEPSLRGAVVTQLPGEFNFQIRFKNGIVHRFERIVGFSNVAGLAAIADRNGNTVTIARATVGGNVFGRITQILEPSGRAFTLAYDGAGRLASVTDPLTRAVRYSYDSVGRLTTVTDPAGGVTTYAYDAAHRIVSITDPRQITFLANDYDANGRVVRQTQADGGAWRFDYALAGTAVTATTVTGPRGARTTYRFSPEGFPVSIVDALGQTTVYDYAPGSNLLEAVTDPLGRRTEYSYDAAGNVVSWTRLAASPSAVSTAIVYEPIFNQPVSVADPLGHTVRLGYDATGNLTSATDALGNTIALTYDDRGDLTSSTDAAGTTGFAHTDGILTAVTDPLGNRWSRRLDPAGRLEGSIDPLGRVTRSQRDPLNRLTALTNPLGGITTLGYDPNGNLVSVTDARGGATRYSYDAMDQLVTRTDPLLRTDSYAYDSAGSLTSSMDRKGQITTRAYDLLDRLVSVTYADGARTTFAYDAVGRLTEVSDGTATTILLSYDALDRLVAETTTRGIVRYTYDLAGRRIAMTAPDQAPVTYAYDDAGRLTEIAQDGATAAFAYDAAHRRTRLTLPNGVVTEYAYDAASRLTALTYRRGASLLGTLSYEYDPAGNRIAVGGTWARTALPPSLASAAYDAANQQVAFADRVLAYDDNGNLTSDGENTYTWDSRDRLVAITGGASATFEYDPLGRRTRKIVAGAPTDVLYDGLNPIQEFGTGAAPTRLMTGLAIDEYLTRTDATGSRSLLADALGSVLALTDPAGAVETEYTYEPFGATVPAGIPSPNPHQFTGRENDGTGLYHYRARYYHPRLQRFIGEDPLGFAGGDANLYAYVFNNPQGFVDPLGETPLAGCLVGGLFEIGEAVLSGRKATLSGFASGCLTGTAGYGVFRAIPMVHRLIRAQQFALRSGYPAVKSSRAAGLYAEEQVADQLAAAGNTIVGMRITAATDLGRRVIDIVMRTPSGEMLAIEVKSGIATRTATQILKDATMASKGATLVGARVPEALRERLLLLRTIVITVP